ncbi:hypothetical protein Hanom_Chr16g01428801 [Helianthus anomalus]
MLVNLILFIIYKTYLLLKLISRHPDFIHHIFPSYTFSQHYLQSKSQTKSIDTRSAFSIHLHHPNSNRSHVNPPNTPCSSQLSASHHHFWWRRT